MLNQIVLVGRLTKKPELKETESKKKYTHIRIAVPRSFKNMEGTYDTDFIDCTLWDVTAKNTVDYCNKGDIIGVRGRVQSTTYEKDGTTVFALEVIAEKITFLSSKKEVQTEN